MTNRTLSRWKHLLQAPITLECPSMKIVGHDSEEPIFAGPGQINIRSRTQIDFIMHAKPRDSGEAFKQLVRSKKNPYGIVDQFRVLATQYNGTEWNGGWTTLHLDDSLDGIWRLSGPIQSLTAGVSGPFVANTSSIEVIYDSKLRIPLPLNMSTSVRRGELEVLRKAEGGSATIDVAGTQIEFFIDPELDATWAVANTSPAFPHPHAENWVSEPLSLLLGQLVFPRLVARNLGDGHALVSLCPASTFQMDTLAASVLQADPLAERESFWQVYGQALTMIARARDKDGQRHFEANPLTRYYYEVIQASHGSNWAWCLTVATVVEGIKKLFGPKPAPTPAHSVEAIADLLKHVVGWSKDLALRDRVAGFLKSIEAEDQDKTLSTSDFLRMLVKDGVIDDAHRKVWNSLRNRVAHGELISPWAEEELEKRMRLLTELLHRVSMKYIEQSSA